MRFILSLRLYSNNLKARFSINDAHLILYLFQQYDEKFLGAAVPQRGHEKKKKEAFKKLVQDVIGVNSFCHTCLSMDWLSMFT